MVVLRNINLYVIFCRQSISAVALQYSHNLYIFNLSPKHCPLYLLLHVGISTQVNM